MKRQFFHKIVSIMAGDDSEDDSYKDVLDVLRKESKTLFSDIIYALTGCKFSEDNARKVWEDVMVHKYYMSQKLGRNVGIKVALVDYFSNHLKILDDFVVVPRDIFGMVVVLANRDELTGLYTHRYFYEKLKEEVSRAKRYGEDFSIALMDLDNFKDVNDTFGHLTGDMVLKLIGRIIYENIRETDIASRYGGDEFALILPETDSKGADILIERLRKKIIEETKVFTKHILLNVSAGVAQYRQGEGVNDIFVRADNNLYEAKRRGKGITVLDTDEKERDSAG